MKRYFPYLYDKDEKGNEEYSVVVEENSTGKYVLYEDHKTAIDIKIENWEQAEKDLLGCREMLSMAQKRIAELEEKLNTAYGLGYLNDNGEQE